MVRFERKDTVRARAAIASLAKAKLHDSGYNTQEVNDALEEMFHGKCYLCEEKGIEPNIEHLMEHGGNLNLKYDWNNLFWSCGHCNNTKHQVRLPILDCSLVDVDQEISFRVLDLLDLDDSDADIEINPLSNSVKTENTCHLLQKYITEPRRKRQNRPAQKGKSYARRCYPSHYMLTGILIQEAKETNRTNLKNSSGN